MKLPLVPITNQQAAEMRLQCGGDFSFIELHYLNARVAQMAQIIERSGLIRDHFVPNPLVHGWYSMPWGQMPILAAVAIVSLERLLRHAWLERKNAPKDDHDPYDPADYYDEEQHHVYRDEEPES